MTYKNVNIPELKPEHFQNGRLYADRREMIKNLGVAIGASIAELGVAQGDFSQFLIDELKPSKFLAIDLFEMEKFPVHWGIPQEILLKGMTHFDYYADRFSHLSDKVQLIRGLSSRTLPDLQDESLDLIYIDAGHDYEHVSSDSLICSRKIKPDGILVFNDYVLFDPFLEKEYGVVQAVNELLQDSDWKVIGFALQKHMFCDIAIRKFPSSHSNLKLKSAQLIERINENDLNRSEPSLENVTSQLCTSRQFHEPVYDRLCKEIAQKKLFHRKQWEYIYILRALEQAGVLHGGASGLGFGCGKEPLAAVMAKREVDVTCTDIAPLEKSDIYWGSTEVRDYFYEGICSWGEFEKHVRFKPVDMNNIPNDLGQHDFIWSSCAFEHLGSLQHGIDFVLNANKCLTAGGVAVHTTELNLGDNADTLESPGLSLYRKQDILRLKHLVEKQGNRMLHINFHTGSGELDRHVDLPPYEQNRHLRLMIAEKYVTTSIGLVIVKQ